LLAVYVLLCSASGFAIYPSLDFKVVKNGNLNREGYILLTNRISVSNYQLRGEQYIAQAEPKPKTHILSAKK
jgi:hypothetical protein